MCLSCCDWVAVPGGGFSWSCYNATADRPCSPYSDCQLRDSTRCGFQYSTYKQVAFCPVLRPPVWPGLVQTPDTPYRGAKLPEVQPLASSQPPSDAAWMLYTGGDRVSGPRARDAQG